jgi:amidase
VLAFADPEDPVSERFVAALGGTAPDYLAALSPTALQGVRLGVRELDNAAYGETVQGPALAVYLAALEVLKAQGATLVTINDPLFAVEFAPLTELGAIFNEFKLSLNQYLATESGPDTFVETLTDIVAYNEQYPDKLKYGQHNLQVSDAQSGSEMDPVYVVSRESAIRSAQTYIDQVMAFYDLDAIVGWDFNTNITITAAAGYPNVTVPMGYDRQVPHGLEFAAQPFEEAKLLGYAYAYEQASHARRAPPLVNPALLSGCGG